MSYLNFKMIKSSQTFSQKATVLQTSTDLDLVNEPDKSATEMREDSSCKENIPLVINSDATRVSSGADMARSTLTSTVSGQSCSYNPFALSEIDQSNASGAAGNPSLVSSGPPRVRDAFQERKAGDTANKVSSASLLTTDQSRSSMCD